jgi:hypothetical protein
VPPVLGFLTCFYIWLSLRTLAKIVGFLWLLTGLLYGAWKTRGFKRRIEFREADDDRGRRARGPHSERRRAGRGTRQAAFARSGRPDPCVALGRLVRMLGTNVS